MVGIWTPSRLTVVNAPTEEVVGTIPRRPFAPAAWVTLKLSLFPLQETPSNEDWLRPSSQVSICRAETTGTPCDKRRGDDRVRSRARGAVGVHVRGEDAVVALGAERLVEQRVDVERVGLARLVGHLGGRLVDVDHRAVEIGEAHRHPGAGEHPRAVLNPGLGPVVVVGVQADAVLQLHLRLGRPVAPGDAVGAVGGRRIEARVVGGEGRELARVEGLELRLVGPVGAVGQRVQRDLEPLALEGGGLGVRDRGARVDVGGAAHALPVGHRAAGRDCRASCVLLEAADGAAVAVVVPGHHHRRLLVSWQEPEPGQRLLLQVHLLDQVGQQVLLLVGLGDGDLVQVDPVGLDVPGLGAEEEIVGADQLAPAHGAVALVPRPGRVALARLDDRAGEVVGEGRGVTALEPTLRIVTAGLEVAVVASE